MKPLSLRIAEHVIKTANPKSHLANRAVVFLHKQEIQEAIQNGHSLLSIWTALRDEGVVNFGYQAFSRHARKSIHLPDRFASINNQPLPNH